MNRRGRPLTSHEAVLNTITATTTRTGLRVEAALDQGSYPTGIAVSHDQLQALPITAHTDHGQWNYSIAPTGGAVPAPHSDERAAARTRALHTLADPRLTGMNSSELDALRARLAPDQQSAGRTAPLRTARRQTRRHHRPQPITALGRGRGPAHCRLPAAGLPAKGAV